MRRRRNGLHPCRRLRVVPRVAASSRCDGEPGPLRGRRASRHRRGAAAASPTTPCCAARRAAPRHASGGRAARTDAEPAARTGDHGRASAATPSARRGMPTARVAAASWGGGARAGRPRAGTRAPADRRLVVRRRHGRCRAPAGRGEPPCAPVRARRGDAVVGVPSASAAPSPTSPSARTARMAVLETVGDDGASPLVRSFDAERAGRSARGTLPSGARARWRSGRTDR